MKKEAEKDSISNILGINFDGSGNQRIKEKAAAALNGVSGKRIFTPNVEILHRCHISDELRSLINSADIVIPDGAGVILASKLLRGSLTERFAGIDMGEYLLSLADESSLRVFLLGGEEGVAKRAATRLSEKYPNVIFSGTHHGFFEKNGEENDAVVNEINRALPHILFVCLGFPCQEKWINENYRRIPSLRLTIGLGGSLNVWSGRIRRAPKIFRQIYLEWLWRILQQPQKISFFLTLPSFLFTVIKERQRILHPSHSKPPIAPKG